MRTSEIHDLLRESVRTFARDRIAPGARERDDHELTDLDLFRSLAGLGLMGITVPEEFGGAGMDVRAATIALEEVAYADAGLSLSFGAHAILTVNNIVHNGNDEQKRRYLPKLASAEWIGSLCMTEPGAGSDAVGGMRTTAVREGDHWVLSGQKTFITNAPYSDVFVVYAKTNPGDRNRALSAFIVERAWEGVSFGTKFEKMGMKSSPTAEVFFDKVKVPAANLLREEGTGTLQMLRNLDVERVTLSGISVGIARAALDKAFAYACERKQFGQAIAGFGMVQAMLADMAAETRAIQLMVMEAARRLDEEPEGRHNRIAAEAKLLSSELATKVAMRAVQILGGYGYIREYGVEQLVRDAKLMEIGAGTSEILRTIIAKEMVRQGETI
jgi:isovaleryl-CoA dehydrogenase